MSLTQAQEEAYAYVRPVDLWVDAIELAHPLLGTPLRFASGIDANTSLPLVSGGSPVVFNATAFRWREGAAATKEGPGEGELAVDGVSGVIRTQIRALSADGNPITCTVLIYRVACVDGVPNFAGVTAPAQRYEGLRIESVRLTATSAVASLKVRDWGRTNFPRQLFSRALYPALHG